MSTYNLSYEFSDKVVTPSGDIDFKITSVPDKDGPVITITLPANDAKEPNHVKLTEYFSREVATLVTEWNPMLALILEFCDIVNKHRQNGKFTKEEEKEIQESSIKIFDKVAEFAKAVVGEDDQ